ncbi:MAG: hypothetical protein CMG64_01150 [Candidatus Marinimicrobia bacterium]|nr:hypothetical protein [Candidatus Neomarinimicrobiota bacterium]
MINHTRNYLFLLFFISSIFPNFGKNIVQYDEFNWSFIQTKHFNIYYYNLNKDHAELTAYNSEKAYKKIEKLLGWGLSKRSDIFVYSSHNDFQQTNIVDIYLEEGIGGVTELMKNRMVIPFDGSLEEFNHVIYHELVHVFINDGIYGGSLLNMLRTSNLMIPLWMNEGLAEYIANPWDTKSEMWMRDLTLNYNEIINIKSLNGYLAYRGGQSVWRFLTHKWGEEIIAEIFSNIKILGNVNKGLEKSTGISLKELNNQWREYLKLQYWPDIEKRDNILNISRRITNHEKLNNSYNIAPAISPDGSLAAIYSNKGGEFSIYLIDTQDGKFISKIVTGQITSEFEELHILRPGVSWSPSGKKIVFAAKSGKSDALFVADVSKKKIKIKKILSDIEGIYRPVWNPKDNQVAFIGNNGMQSDVYIYNINNQNLTNLTNDKFSDSQVSWTSDGVNLLFVSDRLDNIIPHTSLDVLSLFDYDYSNSDIYKFNITNNEIIRLTNTPFNESYPISVFDNTIAFISDESGINNLYLTKDNFSTYQALTNVQTGITQIDWSSSNQIALTGFYKSGYDVFILSNIKQLFDKNISVPKANWIIKNDVLDLKNNKKYKNDYFYRDFNFSDNSFIDNYLKFDISNEDLLDSLGQHPSFKYKTKFSLDYAGGSFTYDILQGAGQGIGYFMFSDKLGNQRIAFQTSLQIDFKQTDLYLRYSNLEDRINWNIYFYNHAYPTNIYFGDTFYELNYLLNKDLSLSLNYQYPLSKFHRIEWGSNFNYLEKRMQSIDQLTNIDYSKQLRSYKIFQPYFSFVWDNTRDFYIYSVNGLKAKINYSFSPNLKFNNNKTDFEFQKLTIDIRNYKEISYDNKVSFASRIFVGTSWGKNERIFGIGGAGENTFFSNDRNFLNADYIDNVIYADSTETEYEFWSMNNFAYPVRGYNIGEKYGKNAAIINFEFRLPFLMYYVPGIKFLGQLFGVIFVDVGVVWNDDFFSMPDFSNANNWDPTQSTGWIMSYGLGPRFTLFGMPWKLDYAWQYNPYKGKISSRRWYLSIGFDY